jgi:sugar transferase (PEP-CTERM/EpsH1 system associated)
MVQKQLKILVLTHRFPFPADKGDRIRAYHWLKALSSRHEVDVLTFSQGAVDERYRRELEKLVCRMEVIPHNNWTLGFRLAWGMLTGRSMTEMYFRSREFDQTFRKMFLSRNYDCCLAICSSMGAQALRSIQNNPLIVDFVDVDSAKWGMYGQKHRGVERWVYHRESRTVAKLERRLAERAQVNITVSRRECELLRQIAPEFPALAIPNGVDTEYFKPSDVSQPLSRLVFVGQMDYFPNVDAVLWFAEHVWPELVQRHPQIHWNIVGRNPTKEVLQLARLQNVSVTGEVPDIRPYLVSAIAIAPLGVACGVQNKVLEAMSAGRPAVVTPGVADGLDVRPQEDLLVANNAKEWILAVDLLLSDPGLASSLGTRARQTMLERFTWDRILMQMVQAVERRGLSLVTSESNVLPDPFSHKDELTE